jgi:hypothetical protein
MTSGLAHSSKPFHPPSSPKTGNLPCPAGWNTRRGISMMAGIMASRPGSNGCVQRKSPPLLPICHHHSPTRHPDSGHRGDGAVQAGSRQPIIRFTTPRGRPPRGAQVNGIIFPPSHSPFGPPEKRPSIVSPPWGGDTARNHHEDLRRCLILLVVILPLGKQDCLALKKQWGGGGGGW